MSNFLSGFCFGLTLSSRCNYMGFGFGGFGFGGFGYGYGYGCGIPSAQYLSTCYCDLEQPTGLNSLVDNGWAINGPYRNPFGFTSCYSPFGLGFGFGMYC